jgi:hypothetical protein
MCSRFSLSGLLAALVLTVSLAGCDTMDAMSTEASLSADNRGGVSAKKTVTIEVVIPGTAGYPTVPSWYPPGHVALGIAPICEEGLYLKWNSGRGEFQNDADHDEYCAPTGSSGQALLFEVPANQVQPPAGHFFLNFGCFTAGEGVDAVEVCPSIQFHRNGNTVGSGYLILSDDDLGDFTLDLTQINETGNVMDGSFDVTVEDEDGNELGGELRWTV